MPLDSARGDRCALTALDLYRGSHGHDPDPSEGCAQLIKARTLKTLPKDPWTHPLRWELQDGEPVVLSLGADGMKGGTAENADLSTADPEE